MVNPLTVVRGTTARFEAVLEEEEGWQRQESEDGEESNQDLDEVSVGNHAESEQEEGVVLALFLGYVGFFLLFGGSPLLLVAFQERLEPFFFLLLEAPCAGLEDGEDNWHLSFVERVVFFDNFFCHIDLRG